MGLTLNAQASKNISTNITGASGRDLLPVKSETG